MQKENCCEARTFMPLNKDVHLFPNALFNNQKVTLWSTNNYLGMAGHKNAIDVLTEEARRTGVSAGGTRNISGTHPLHDLLEETLARLHRKEKALIFNSGYAANEGTLWALSKLLPDCYFFSDEENHASIISGFQAGQSTKYIFRHNDLSHLEYLLQKAPAKTPKVIVCESVYSMSGSKAPLKEIVKLADTYNALLYVDEVHAVGLYGPQGAGLSAQENVQDKVTLIQGTLGKAFGTIGGYVAGSRVMIDLIRSCARPFIFSTALPPFIIAAALENVKACMADEIRRQKFWQTVTQAKQALIKANLPITKTDTHIIPLLIPENQACKDVSNLLLTQHQIYTQPINYPSVPRGKERLRLTPLYGHTDEMIRQLVTSLQSCRNRIS